MFAVYGSTGRVFQGTLEQMRRIPLVHASSRSRAIEPTLRNGRDSALREAAETERHVVGGLASAAGGETHHPAIAAYAAAQQMTPQGWYDTEVGEVMSQPALTLPDSMDVQQAWKALIHQGHRQAPVVNSASILVGLVTRDGLTGHDPWPQAGGSAAGGDAWLQQSVEAVMVTPIPSVAPSADLRRAATALLESGLPGLPVVDDAGRVIGFVSHADVLRAALKDAGLDVWG